MLTSQHQKVRWILWPCRRRSRAEQKKENCSLVRLILIVWFWEIDWQCGSRDGLLKCSPYHAITLKNSNGMMRFWKSSAFHLRGYAPKFVLTLWNLQQDYPASHFYGGELPNLVWLGTNRQSPLSVQLAFEPGMVRHLWEQVLSSCEHWWRSTVVWRQLWLTLVMGSTAEFYTLERSIFIAGSAIQSSWWTSHGWKFAESEKYALNSAQQWRSLCRTLPLQV